jgi:hypothetical protein
LSHKQNRKEDEFIESYFAAQALLNTINFPPFQLSIADGSIEELKKIYEECKGLDSTVFDFDFSNPQDPEYFKNQLRVALCLVKDDTVSEYEINHRLFKGHSKLS